MKNICVFISLVACFAVSCGQPKVKIEAAASQKVIPALIGKDNNVVLRVRINTEENKESILRSIKLSTQGTTDWKDIETAGVYYTGQSGVFQDHGQTWQTGTGARSNTSEAQVAEVDAGVLMLNMRDNRGGSRAVSITRDLGKTWEEHPSSRSALREPVCMASLIKVDASRNNTGKDILLFSNPNTEKGRYNMTIKTSFDGGLTWPEQNQLLLDEGIGWGYSCLTMIDPETVGILYEGSGSHLVFQAIPLKEIVYLTKY